MGGSLTQCYRQIVYTTDMDTTVEHGFGVIEKGVGIIAEVMAILDLLHGACIPGIVEAVGGLILWKDADRRLRS